MGVYLKNVMMPSCCHDCEPEARKKLEELLTRHGKPQRKRGHKMYEVLVDMLRICGNEEECKKCRQMDSSCGGKEVMIDAADAIERLNKAYQMMAEAYEIEVTKEYWIPVTERMPKCEQEVLICTEKKSVGRDAYIDSIVIPAIYEDGTMRENDSIWHWVDIDWAGWDEEEDCGIIPEGWWENRHYNPDGVYNNPVDSKVVAWMALPKSYDPPKEE